MNEREKATELTRALDAVLQGKDLTDQSQDDERGESSIGKRHEVTGRWVPAPTSGAGVMIRRKHEAE